MRAQDEKNERSLGLAPFKDSCRTASWGRRERFDGDGTECGAGNQFGNRFGTSVPNLRDVGGYTTADGSVVRRGVVYRSNQLNAIRPDETKKIAAMGLKNDFDLRTAAEREAKPDELPAGVKNV